MDEISDIFKMLKPSCVEINATDFRGNLQIGSGFSPAEGYVVTCAHVLGMIYEDDKQPDHIIFKDSAGKSVAAQFLAAEVSSDIALISFELSEVSPIPIASSSIILDGEEVICMGSPLGYQNTISSGIVSNAAGTKKSTFLVDVRINPGNSGGIIYSLARESAIGIASAVVFATGDVKSSGIGVGIDTATIKSFLERNGVPYLEA